MGVGNGICGQCHGPILWAITTNGKSVPLDRKPNLAGNVAVWVDENEIPNAFVITDDRPAKSHERIHMVHFATCPKRKKPKTTAVTARNQHQIERRRPAEQQPIPMIFPDNVVPIRRRRNNPT